MDAASKKQPHFRKDNSPIRIPVNKRIRAPNPNRWSTLSAAVIKAACLSWVKMQSFGRLYRGSLIFSSVPAAFRYAGEDQVNLSV